MPDRDDLYHDAVSTYGPALERLARAYEAGSEDRQDLLQEIHLALWRSFASFDARCSLRTWVYRVGHNAAVSHILRSRRRKPEALVSIEEIAERGDAGAASIQSDAADRLDRRRTIDHLYALIQRLNPVDRQIILLYLEDVDAATIGEVMGISPGYVATKIHRIKKLLAERFWNGGER